MRIFHIVAPGVWAAALETGEYRPASLESEGFVHFSFAEQVAGTANLLYRDEPELLVVEIEPNRVTGELRIEDSYGGGTQFPHLYGPLPVSAAVATHSLQRGGNGDWGFIPGDAAAPASPDR